MTVDDATNNTTNETTFQVRIISYENFNHGRTVKIAIVDAIESMLKKRKKMQLTMKTTIDVNTNASSEDTTGIEGDN
jgi:hypothetical protein